MGAVFLVICPKSSKYKPSEFPNPTFAHLRSFAHLRKMAPSLLATLLPYQQEARDWCLDREANGCILAYDMGLGKTVISCAVIAANPVKTLVMVPASLLDQWVTELQRHTEGFNITVYHGTQRNSKVGRAALKRADIIVSTAAVVARDLHNGVEIPAGRWIIDEAHRLKNSYGVSYGRLYAEAGAIENKIFLTGTPVCNRCSDLIALIGLTNREPYNNLKSWKKMKEKEKIKRLKEVLPEALLRRTKEDTIPELLPTIQTKNIPIKLHSPSQQRDFYESFMEDDELLRRILRMRQSANCYSQLFEKTQKRLGIETPQTASEISVKITTLTELLSTIPAGEKILVFSQFTSLLSHLNTLFPGNYFYHGGLNSLEKSAVIDAFKAAEPATEPANGNILFINLRAGGCGLNLTEANHVILMEPYWNESEQKQAIDRVYRIGQKRPVTVYRFYIRYSIESWLHSLQKSKQLLANHLINTASNENALEHLERHRANTSQIFHNVAFSTDSIPKQILLKTGEMCPLDEYLESEGIF